MPIRLNARRLRNALAGVPIVLCTLASARHASAQVHWDLGTELGLEKRFLRGIPEETGDASFGPLLRVTAHWALLPLARIGVYGALGLSPVNRASLRTQFGGGLEARAILPLGIRDFRPFFFVGFGYMRTVTPSYEVTRLGTGVTSGTFRTTGTSGGCLDVPLGIGGTYRIRKPIELGAVIGTRFSAVCGGSSYPDNSAYVVPTTVDTAFRVNATPGKDIFGLWVSAMLNLEF